MAAQLKFFNVRVQHAAYRWFTVPWRLSQLSLPAFSSLSHLLTSTFNSFSTAVFCGMFTVGTPAFSQSCPRSFCMSLWQLLFGLRFLMTTLSHQMPPFDVLGPFCPCHFFQNIFFNCVTGLFQVVLYEWYNATWNQVGNWEVLHGTDIGVFLAAICSRFSAR